ncbi:alpha/beta hydrolase [Mesonia maritima]|uniref:Acetyl esterase/lipase n=1 Tax=Mesonia maritima TaxID=1793873 RepID=A0ABU1KA58_9FLAO|nr:alpha/beta hydrolase [Mesonia maritima]MDR6302140.1 acetyl esterase/lipase [Mesonia maritima]
MKKQIQKIIAITFFISILASCSSDDDGSSSTKYDAETAYELKNIPYGKQELQVADIYLPANRNANDTKVMLLIHGGAWVSGDKKDVDYIVDIARDNFPEYAVVNMNYRFPDDENTAFPMQINDVEMLVEHLQDNREEYTISEEMGIIGVSAGAHLALLYSYAYDDENKANAVCSIVGRTDFTDENYLNSSYYDVFRQILIGDVEYEEHPEEFEKVSPVYQVTASAPPTIMFYGDQDPLVPVTQGPLLENKLNAEGIYNEFYLYEGVGHGDWDAEGFLDVENKLVNFLEEYL